MDNSVQEVNICRICKLEGTPEQPLFHPCICTGSIKYVHQNCLIQWMRYSHNEYCEVCSHQISFAHIYTPDISRTLIIKDVVAGIIFNLLIHIIYGFYLTLVGFTWLCILPLTVSLIYRSIFNGPAVRSLIDANMHLNIIWSSLRNTLIEDIHHGHLILICTTSAFIGFIWLADQILREVDLNWFDEVQPNNEQRLDGLLLPIPDENLVGEADGEILQDNENEEDGNEDEDEDEDEDENDLNLNLIGRDLILERFLGLDMSFLFIKNVFLVVSLNTISILIIAFCPYQMGNLAITTMALQDKVVASQFEGLVTTLCGYCLVSISLLIVHNIATIIGFRRSKCIIELCYIVVKVLLIWIVEIGVLPLLCGWWLDICSFSMFDLKFEDRLTSSHSVIDTSMVIHWLFGAVYLFYFRSFILTIQEIVRPGVLWFLQDLINFSSKQKLIQQNMLKHGQRLIRIAMIVGTAVFLGVWLPIHILKFIWPSFLPYNVRLFRKSDFVFVPLIQIVLPKLFLELSQSYNLLKMGIRFWCIVVSYLLGIKSYLLGDTDELLFVVAPKQPPAVDELLIRGNRIRFQSYIRSTNFFIRLNALLILVAISTIIISLSVITIPVWLGRLTIFWLPLSATSLVSSQLPKVNELITAIFGTYIFYYSITVVCFITRWLLEGRTVFINRLKFWFKIIPKVMVAYIVFLGIIPFLYGLLIDLVIVMPIETPLYQSPMFLAEFEWLVGLSSLHVTYTFILMGPNWFLRQAIILTYRRGFMQFNLKLLIRDLALPVIVFLSLFLTVPYVIAYSVVPIIFKNPSIRLLIPRLIYPIFTLMCLGVGVIMILVNQFKWIYKNIKKDKYLLGRRLTNYNYTSPVLGQNL